MKVSDFIHVTNRTKDEVAALRLKVKIALYKKALKVKSANLAVSKG